MGVRKLVFRSSVRDDAIGMQAGPSAGLSGAEWVIVDTLDPE